MELVVDEETESDGDFEAIEGFLWRVWLGISTGEEEEMSLECLRDVGFETRDFEPPKESVCWCVLVVEAAELPERRRRGGIVISLFDTVYFVSDKGSDQLSGCLNNRRSCNMSEVVLCCGC